ncbi:MAG TPA: carboxypeptidase-like regulatory domain-containing protein [Candidatus Sulfotelmatobacter sp.]|nr:carboxypeptidase-like regulatory domain-containing protein [Candidatus Sulfotelmatobacter sp.]
MMSKRILFVLMACVTALCFSPRLFGQAIGSFSGTITDKSGSSIAGASVTITSQGTGVVRDTKTDETGHYIVNYLPVGAYTIHVQFQGFQPAEAKDLRLQIDESRELDFALNPASVSSTVEVTADAVAVTTTDPTLGQVINSQQVAQLPLNGRDFVQLATLTPGTVQETNPTSFFNGGPSSEVSARGSFSLSVGGSRANSTDWLLDGNDNNELTAGGIAILSSIDSIQEFKVLTYNYSAEFGTRAGPTVLVTTRSGSNSYHGTLYEFLRNTSLDAKSFFATSPEKFNLNQYGGAIGGPIRKNKTFFFIDGEQKSQRHGITFTGLVPTDAMRAGDFSKDPFGNTLGAPTKNADGTFAIPSGAIINPNLGALNGAGASSDPNAAQNIYFQCDANGVPEPLAANGSQTRGNNCYKIPGGLLNPIGQKLMALYPEPNANNPGAGFNYVDSPVRKLDETKFDIRLDQTFTATDTAFARFSYDQAVSYVPGGAPGFPIFAEQSPFASNQGIQNHARNIALSETHVFSPTKVNQAYGGYNRIFNYITSEGDGTCLAAQFGIPGANLGCQNGTTCQGDVISCGLTSTQLSGGFYSLGDRGFAPFTGGTNVFKVGDSFDMILGKHDIKMGGDVRAMQMNVRTNGFQDGYWILTGLWSGNPEGDLALGLPSLAIHDQTFLGDTTGRRWKMYRPFVQDDWRATKDLTLNLGLAWDITTPIAEVAGRQADFNPANGQFLIPGVNGVSDGAGIQTNWKAFEPRIGLAYKVRGSDKTVVRAGYAIFHDSSWNQGAQGLWQNPPFYAESDSFTFGGACTFATAACATVFGLQPGANSLSNGFPIFTSQPVPTSFSGTLQAQNTNFKQGQVQQFNVNIEHQLPADIVLTVGYAGSRSAHILIDGNNLNVSSPSACGAVAGYTLGCGPGGTFVPQPAQFAAFPFNTISNITDQGMAHYNSLQVKAETKNARHGLYALIGYTYSRSYDNGFTDGVGSSIGATYYPLPNWSKLDWALSQINLNNNFTASVIYDLPFGRGKQFGSNWSNPVNTLLGGWQLTVIEHISSGFPIFIVDGNNTSGVNFQNNGNSLIRPNQVCNPNNGVSQSINEWFNVNCFAAPPTVTQTINGKQVTFGELGDANRTPVNGPNFVNTDFSVIKRFALPWENTGLDFRAEIFNLFNHAQFGLPGNDFNAPGTFGKINSTVNGPRLVQFGLKFTF